MSSGDNNNPKQPNNFPAVSSSSLRVLGNQVQVLDDVLKERDPEYWYQKGVDAAKADDGKKQAFHFFSRCLILNPKHGSAYLNRSLLNAKPIDKINDLNKALEFLSNQHDRTYAFYCRGLYKNKIGDVESAISDFNECILLGNKSAAYYYEIIKIRYQQGKLDETLSECNRAINDGIKSGLIYYKSAEVKIKLKDYTGALADLNIGIELEPEKSFWYAARHNVNKYLGHTTEAQQDLVKYNVLKSQQGK